MTTARKRARQKANRRYMAGGHTAADHEPKPEKVPGVRRPKRERCETCQPTRPPAAPPAVGKVSEWRGSGKQLLDLLPGVRVGKHARGRATNYSTKSR
ncbi:MAG TPA: hypothetical protein VMU95_41205 [Trebonia sp.]|nr:hypothetical protein [Trebonia sp.]